MGVTPAAGKKCGDAAAGSPPALLVRTDSFCRFPGTNVDRRSSREAVTAPFTIRPAKLADAPTLAVLYRNAYAANVDLGFPSRAAEADRAALETWLREARFYVASREGKLVGSVRYRSSGKYDPDAAEFGRLAVPPRARGEGIGSALVDRVETVARRERNDRMRLRTFDGHPFLADMYRRRGYEAVRVRRLESAPFDVLHMEKRLSGDRTEDDLTSEGFALE